MDAGSPGHFCRGCGAIQPAAPDRNYFRVLGMASPSFNIDNRQLEAAYKDFQKLLHPDKFSTASQTERQFSDEQAALVNQAYSTLKVPLRRAQYMLQLHGISHDEATGPVDPALLMRVMEDREAVEATEDKAELQGLLDENSGRQRALIQQLSNAFGQGDLHLAEHLTMELTYEHRIAEAIMHKL